MLFFSPLSPNFKPTKNIRVLNQQKRSSHLVVYFSRLRGTLRVPSAFSNKNSKRKKIGFYRLIGSLKLKK
jgi:hypothetical protein